VVLRQLPGQRATVDGRFEIDGSYAYYWGFEVMDSDPKRVTAISGSDPSDLPRQNVTVFVIGPFNKLINMVVHDLGDGLFAGSLAEGLEISGSVFYNNGWQGPDKGYGHHLYLQNQNATKQILDNVLFNSFATGLQIYGTDAAYLFNFNIEGNTIFGSGDPVAAQFTTRYNVEQRGAGGNFGHTVYKGNSIYHRNGKSLGVAINGAGEPPGQDIQFINNIVHGQSRFNEVIGYSITGNKFTTGFDALSGQDVLLGFRTVSTQPYSSNVWTSNQYASPAGGTQDPFYVFNTTGVLYKFAGWRSTTGYDASSSYLDGQFNTTDVIVRPNRYEKGRAVVTCWNWTGAASVKVDLSSVLKPGDHFAIRHVFNIFGAPVITGVYNGAAVSVPQGTLTPPTPIGYKPSPSMPDNRFNVFIVTKQ